MSDVGAVVLTLGERTTERALSSLAAQTLSVEEVAVVDGVRPFHRAFNSGAVRLSAPYFVQVDADMVLDRDCVELLRSAMSPGVGIAVGALRDPLMGIVAGVKMFRRSCLDVLRLRDTIAPEIDHYVRLARLGWQTPCLTGRGSKRGSGPALGAHLPDYTVDYVFGTYYLLGRLYAHRGLAPALRWRFDRLRAAAHPAAPVARLAMARGVLGGETRDASKPRPQAADSAFLRRLIAAAPDGTIEPRPVRRLTALATGTLFEAFHALGASLRMGPPDRLRAWLEALAGIHNAAGSLLAEVALGGGLLAASPSRAPIDATGAFERLAAAWTASEPLERAA